MLAADAADEREQRALRVRGPPAGTEHAAARNTTVVFIWLSPSGCRLAGRLTYLDVYSPLALGDCQAQVGGEGAEVGEWMVQVA